MPCMLHHTVCSLFLLSSGDTWIWICIAYASTLIGVGVDSRKDLRLLTLQKMNLNIY
jgi:hypothetical protein